MIRKPGETTWRTPAVTAYADERAIQAIIEQSPDLLPGTTGGRMAVVSELTVVNAGYIDVVGVDADGTITIVECKLKANPEIRRHIVGQVLAYAAGLWGQTYDEFDQVFAARAGVPLAKRVSDLAADEWDEEAFRAAVTANLERGRFRLVIAVDEITEELGRIVRYLNEHTSPDLQVLALELKFVADHGVEILLPTVYGKEGIESKAATAERRRWDETSFFASIEACCSPEGYQAARRLFDFAKARGGAMLWGSGALPSVTARVSVAGKPASLYSLYEWPKGTGTLAVNFEYLLGYVPIEALSRLANRLRAIPGVAERYEGLEQGAFKKRPSLSLDQILSRPGAVDQVQTAFDEVMKGHVASE